jgi:hypothetical protein
VRRLWTDSEIEALKILYPDMHGEEIADALGRSVISIYACARIYGLHKSDDFIKSEMSGRLTKLTTSGKKYRFRKGHIPANKGKRWDEYMSKEGQMKSLAYTFKKGHLPLNAKSDGEITIRFDEGLAYRWIRISRAKWQMLHVHNWIEAFGSVPDGYIVVFKTPDRSNCNISNLELITRAENMKRNTIHRYPPELKNTIRTFSKLKRLIDAKEQDSGPEGTFIRDNSVA